MSIIYIYMMSHRYFLYICGGDVSRLPGAAARREPPVRAAALEDEEWLARGEAQRVPLPRAEGEQRAIHHPTLTRPSRVNGALIISSDHVKARVGESQPVSRKHVRGRAH